MLFRSIGGATECVLRYMFFISKRERRNTLRHRERGSTIGPETLYLGTRYYDFTPPYGNGPWVMPYDYNSTLYSEKPVTWETCDDELHPGPPYRQSGPLDIFKFDTDQYEVKAPVDVASGLYRYAGKHLPVQQPASWLDYSGSTADFQAAKSAGWGDVSSYGPVGWNKLRPTKPDVDVGTFLGEIKEVPRMLQTTARGFAKLWRHMKGDRMAFGPKDVANHWLNTQFGWFPFLSTLRDFYTTTKNLDQRLKQLRRDNGKWVRRRGSVHRETESEILASVDGSPGLSPVLVSGLYDSPYGSYTIVSKRTQKVWFEGAFRYWIPGKPGSWEWNAKAVTLLYGMQPSPSLIWELTPWSWLIDWCSNAGDVIANMTSIVYDNLCAKYADVMGTTSQEVVFTGSSNYKTGTITESWSAKLLRKSRVHASPFGFGLTSLDFTARQWSILAALGITRLR